MQTNYWNHKRVLITGAGGFVGSHLVKYLDSKHAVLTTITRRSEKDVSEYSQIAKVFAAQSFDICFHLAADALVESGKDDPYQTIKNNVLSTLNILELSRVYALKRIIIASTVHVYGDGAEAFREEDPPKPSRPYETSKTCVDLIAQSYADTFHVPVLIPRFVNIYGPGDRNVSRIIPKTIQNILQNKKPVLWGGSSTRDYLYIDDAISAFDKLAQITDVQIEKNRIYNFGTDEAISAQHLVKKIMSISGVQHDIRYERIGRADEITRQLVTWNKAKRVLGWRPKISLDEGIQLTVDWYRSNPMQQQRP